MSIRCLFFSGTKIPQNILSFIDHNSLMYVSLFIHCHQQKLQLTSRIGGKHGETLANKAQPKKNNIHEGER